MMPTKSLEPDLIAESEANNGLRVWDGFLDCYLDTPFQRMMEREYEDVMGFDYYNPESDKSNLTPKRFYHPIIEIVSRPLNSRYRGKPKIYVVNPDLPKLLTYVLDLDYSLMHRDYMHRALPEMDYQLVLLNGCRPSDFIARLRAGVCDPVDGFGAQTVGMTVACLENFDYIVDGGMQTGGKAKVPFRDTAKMNLLAQQMVRPFTAIVQEINQRAYQQTA